MTKLNSIVAGGCFPSPSLPRPTNMMDRLLTPARSERLAGTQASQLESIQQGLRDGTISQKEASSLMDQQARISEATARAGADGVVTGAEAAAIRMMQAQAEADVFDAGNSFELENFFEDPSIRETQASQVGSIAEGVRSGDLSGREAGSLLRDQGRIARAADRAQDGFFSDPIASLGVSLSQWQAEQKIDTQKNDFETAPHGRLSFPIFF